MNLLLSVEYKFLRDKISLIVCILLGFGCQQGLQSVAPTASVDPVVQATDQAENDSDQPLIVTEQPSAAEPSSERSDHFPPGHPPSDHPPGHSVSHLVSSGTPPSSVSEFTYGPDGYDRQGLNREGFDVGGVDAEGYNQQGYHFRTNRNRNGQRLIANPEVLRDQRRRRARRRRQLHPAIGVLQADLARPNRELYVALEEPQLLPQLPAALPEARREARAPERPEEIEEDPETVQETLERLNYARSPGRPIRFSRAQNSRLDTIQRRLPMLTTAAEYIQAVAPSVPQGGTRRNPVRVHPEQLAQTILDTIDVFFALRPTIEQVLQLIAQNGDTSGVQMQMVLAIKRRAIESGLVKQVSEYCQVMEPTRIPHSQRSDSYVDEMIELLVETLPLFFEGERSLSELQILKNFVTRQRGPVFRGFRGMFLSAIEERIAGRPVDIRAGSIATLENAIQQQLSLQAAENGSVFKYYLINSAPPPPSVNEGTSCPICTEEVLSDSVVICRGDHPDLGESGGPEVTPHPQIAFHLRSTEFLDHVLRELDMSSGFQPVTCGDSSHPHELPITEQNWVEMKAGLQDRITQLEEGFRRRSGPGFRLSPREISEKSRTIRARIEAIEEEILGNGDNVTESIRSRLDILETEQHGPVLVLGQQNRRINRDHPNYLAALPLIQRMDELENEKTAITARLAKLTLREELEKRRLQLTNWDLQIRHRWKIQTLIAYYRNLRGVNARGLDSRSQGFIFCDSDACRSVVSQSEIRENGHYRCQNCQEEHCYYCAYNHPSQTCEEALVTHRGGGISQLVHDLSGDVRPCPYCDPGPSEHYTLIHRYTACFHMDCPACGSSFNWELGRLRENTESATSFGTNRQPRKYLVKGDPGYVPGKESAYPETDGRIVRRGSNNTNDPSYNPDENGGYIQRRSDLDMDIIQRRRH